MYRSLIMLVLTAAMAACSPSPQKPQAKKTVVPVNAMKVAIIDHPRYIEVLGYLKPATFVEVRPQVSGILAEVNFIEGQLVSKGQPLFNIDPAPYKNRLQEVHAQKVRDAAALEAARKKMERFQGLAKKELISHQEWDELSAEVEKHVAQLQADEAQEASAALDLARCTIVAPISGKTGRLAFHSGSLVTSSQSSSLVAIACVECLLVEFSITEKDYLQLRQMPVAGVHNEKGVTRLSMEVNSLKMPEVSLKGLVTFSDYGFDNRSGLLLLRGEVQNQNNLFLPGQSVKVKLPLESAKNTILIPDRAIKFNQEGPFVYRISESNIAEVCQIRKGEEFEGMAEITEGLKEGDIIVTEGHLRLYPGVSVELNIISKAQQ